MVELVLYLGVPVFSSGRINKIRKRVLWSVQVRLHFGTQKTADALQRCTLARAIVVPKITSLSRHSSPTAKIV